MFYVKLQSIRILHSSFFTSYIPGILGMPGIPFMRLIICAILLLGHHLHHLSGLVKLLDEFVHLLDVGARTLSDALAA